MKPLHYFPLSAAAISLAFSLTAFAKGIHMSPPDNVFAIQGVQIAPGSGWSETCVLSDESVVCGNYRQSKKPIPLTGMPSEIAAGTGLCILEDGRLRCFDEQPNPVTSDENVSQFLIQGGLTCALTQGKVKCAGASGEYSFFRVPEFFDLPDSRLDQLENVQFLFRLSEEALCAQKTDDAYCWNSNFVEYESDPGSAPVFKLSRVLTIPETTSLNEIRFLQVKLGWAKRYSKSRKSQLIEYSYVSGTRLYKNAAILTSNRHTILGLNKWYTQKLKPVPQGQIAIDLNARPLAPVLDTPCYLFDSEVRCFDVPVYSYAEDGKENWTPGDFKSRHSDLVRWLEAFDSVSQISAKKSVSSPEYTICVLMSEGLNCAYESSSLRLDSLEVQNEVTQNAGASIRLSLRNFAASLRRISGVVYFERGNALIKQAEIFEAEQSEIRSANMFTLFTASLVRPFVENIDSAIISQNVLPHFRSTLDQALSASGISALADFGFDPVLTRTAIRTLVVDLQILKQHVTAPADRLLIEQAVSSLGNALASKLKASIGIQSLQNLLETLSTSPRSRCYALQALVVIEYLLKGEMLAQ